MEENTHKDINRKTSWKRLGLVNQNNTHIYQVFRKFFSEIYELINLKLLIGISSNFANLLLIMILESM